MTQGDRNALAIGMSLAAVIGAIIEIVQSDMPGFHATWVSILAIYGGLSIYAILLHAYVKKD